MADGKKITELLLQKYPSPKIALNFSNPLELLIATILSAQCTDKRVNVVTEKLFVKYRTAGDYAAADPAAFEEDIHSTGFFRNKAKAILAACEKVDNEFGEVPGSMEELTSLPGVGRKTANVVLGGAFGRQTIAVDTHMIRLSNRLGLTVSKNPDRIEQDLMKAIPEEKWSRFNIALILHGRETCKARKPLCETCVLFPACGWEDKESYL